MIQAPGFFTHLKNTVPMDTLSNQLFFVFFLYPWTNLKQGILTVGRLSAIDLLIKVGYFVRK
jgi:hypothetical protein